MPTNAQPSAGAVIAIGDAMPATLDKVGYESVSWTTIGEVTNIPEFGKVFNLQTFNPLADRKTYKFKTTYNNGSTTLEYGFVPGAGDAGQNDLNGAVESDDSFPFRIILNDAETYIYYGAKVMSRPINIGTADGMLMGTTTLELDEDVLFTTAPTS